MANRPTHNITAKRKDGKETTYTKFGGEKVTKLYAYIGSAWTKEFDGETIYDLKMEAPEWGKTITSETHWISMRPGRETPATDIGAGRRRSGPHSVQNSDPDIFGDAA